MKNTPHIKILLITTTCLLLSCKSTDEVADAPPLTVNKSFLSAPTDLLNKSDTSESNKGDAKQQTFSNIKSISRSDVLFQSAQLAKNFSAKKSS
jgi:hypothetical protein